MDNGKMEMIVSLVKVLVKLVLIATNVKLV